MILSDNMWLKVCEELVKLSVIPDGKIYKHHVSPIQNEEVVLQIETEENKYELNLFVNENSKSSNISNEYPTVLIGNNSVNRACISINRVLIEGYECYSYENVNDISDCKIIIIKSVLKALAYSHSRSLQMQNPSISDKCEYFLRSEDFKETLCDLYKIIEQKSKEEINMKLFEESVKKLHISNCEILNQQGNIYVQSSSLQSKLFFRCLSGGIMNCKIINTVFCKRTPLVYDLLFHMFFMSSQKLRQHYFHDLLKYYYNELKENLHKTELDISNVLPLEKYQQQIKEFLPYVKSEVTLIKCRRYLKSLEILENRNFLNIIYDNAMWENILEVYDTILYTKLSREDCYKIIENKLGSRDYEFINWELNPLEKRAGFLGDYYKLKIHVIHNGETKTLNLFLKYLPTYSEVTTELAQTTFQKEEFFYRKFITEAVRVGLDEITNFAPKCYFSRSNDVIVLEDMSVLNCKSLSKGEALSYENVSLVTRQLAKLHASSLLYEEIMSVKFEKSFRIGDEYPKFIEEALLIIKDGKPDDIMACGADGSLKYILDEFPDIPKRITMDEFKKELRILYDEMLLGDLKSDTFRNVLSQGDPWGNNFLFKRDEHDNPTECYLVDFQLIRYCPPSHELLFCIYLNTDKDTRNKYMSKILEQYYSELSLIFKKYNFDLSKIYTYENFLKSCDIMKPVAICLASLYLQIVLCPQKKVDDIFVDEEKTKHILTIDRKEFIDEIYHNDFYRKRMREIVEDLYEICERNVVRYK